MPYALWKARCLRLLRSGAERIHLLLEKSGLARLRAVQALKRGGKRRIKRWLNGNLLLIEVDGLPMYIFNRPHFVGAHVVRHYEPYTLRLFKNAVKPGATVLDVGANVGYFTLIAARQAGRGGRIYAFEPGPDNVAVLARNIKINKFQNVTVVPKAVSDRAGTANLVLGEDSDQHSLFGPPMVASSGTVAVECVALDDFLQDAPDVIKLDVEGNELFALNGMRRTLERSEPLVMFVELNPVCLRQANMEPEDLVSKLREFGFEIRVIDEQEGSLDLLTDSYLREIRDHTPGWFTNLYCTKNQKHQRYPTELP